MNNSAAIASKHHNKNLLCAIDVETTGLIPGTHEIIQLAVIPLAPDLTPSKYFKPLEIRIRPENQRVIHPDYRGLNSRLVKDASLNGLERWASVAFFERWFKDLRLPPGKILTPLGCNYEGFDQLFLIEYFGGPESYREFFRSDVRDVQRAAGFINDMADWRNLRIPFPKINLGYLCSCLSIANENQHDAVYDARASAEIYRRMMRMSDSYMDKPTAELDRYYALLATQYANYRLTCKDEIPMLYTEFKTLWEKSFGKAVNVD